MDLAKAVIATLPVGYADGYYRSLGNLNSRVFINGEYCPVVGNVCMDMIMVDVTSINCLEGDEVVLFGSSFSAEGIAEAVDTISYELITGISQRITRKIIK